MFIRELIPISKAASMLNIRSSIVKDFMLLGILEYTTTHSLKIFVYKDSVETFIKSQKKLEEEKKYAKREN